jgi:hypothetical protein
MGGCAGGKASFVPAWANVVLKECGLFGLVFQEMYPLRDEEFHVRLEGPGNEQFVVCSAEHWEELKKELPLA